MKNEINNKHGTNLENELKVQFLYQKEWYDIDLANIRKNNIIRVLDKNNNPKKLHNDDQFIERIVIDDAFNNEDNSWTIKSMDYDISTFSNEQLELLEEMSKNEKENK